MSETRQRLSDAAAVLGIAYVSYWVSTIPVSILSLMMAGSIDRREPWAFPTFLALQWICDGVVTGLGVFLLIHKRSGQAWALTVAGLTAAFLLVNNRFSGAPFPGVVWEAISRSVLSGSAAGLVVMALSKRRAT